MDRLQFVKSIGYDNFKESIVRFFDENMALYNLVGEYKNINCITGNVDDKSITFDLKFNNVSDSNKMYLGISENESICIYGCTYKIEVNLNGDTINIRLIDIDEKCGEC